MAGTGSCSPGAHAAEKNEWQGQRGHPRSAHLPSPQPPAPQPCRTALRETLETPINCCYYYPRALSRGERYHSAGLQIPDAGSEAPGSLRTALGAARSAHTDPGHRERGAWVTQPCSSVLVLAQGGGMMKSKDETPSFSTHTARERL